ncbi:hypothetical protein JW890_07935 [candidate division WOR-3 bacterium]|nr:hypothetical protein [candidate division WOR-3 bacterium]
MNYIEIALKSSANLAEKPFEINANFAEMLLSSGAEKIGIYLRTLSGGLSLCESNTEAVPKNLVPNISLKELSKKDFEGLFYFENPPYKFYILGDKPLNPYALILSENPVDNRGMWQTISLFYKMIFFYRREAVKSEHFDVIVAFDEKLSIIKGEEPDLSFFRNLSAEELPRILESMTQIKSRFLLPSENVWGRNKVSIGNETGAEGIREKAAFIRKHAESVLSDMGRSSPYFTELSSISKTASKIIALFENNP